MASKGHFFTQIPHPIHSSSEIVAILKENVIAVKTNHCLCTHLSLGVTSMHSLPILTTGQDFLHSCLHLLGLHLSVETMAILVNLSVSSSALLFLLGGILLWTLNQTHSLVVQFVKRSESSNLVMLRIGRGQKHSQNLFTMLCPDIHSHVCPGLKLYFSLSGALCSSHLLHKMPGPSHSARISVVVFYWFDVV